MHVVVRAATGEREVRVWARGPVPTVADLLAAMGSPAAGIDVDGRYAPADLSLAEAGVVEGAVLVPAERHAPTYDAPPAPPRHLTVVAGRDAGRRLPLPRRGTVVVGRGPESSLRVAADTVSARHAEVVVGDDGVTVRDLHSANGTWVAGRPATQALPLTPGGHVRLGGVVLRLDGPPPADRPGPQRHRSAHVPFNRPPRQALPPPAPTVVAPGPAPEPPRARPLSVAAVVAPLVMAGALVAIYGSLRFALFALLSPVMAVGNGWSARRQAGREGRAAAAEHRAALDRLGREQAAANTAERTRREAVLPDIAEVLRRAAGPSTALWQRRPGDEDVLQLRVGTADVTWRPEVDAPREGPGDAAEERLVRGGLLHDLPVGIDLRAGGVVGLVGDRDAALGLARSLLLQAAVHHGPADLPALLAVAPDVAASWDWAKWLPHVRDPGGDVRRLAVGRAAAERLATELLGTDGSGDGPTWLVVVDALDLLEGRGAPVRRLLGGEAGPVAGIVLAPSEDRLPAATTVVVDLASDAGDAEVRHPRTAERQPDVLAALLPEPAARDAARRLARFEDPEQPHAAADLPDLVRLLPLLDLPDDLTAEHIARGWDEAGADPAAAAPIGVGPDGPVVVDLAADGPHGLVGGTTGSGKSELLRSFVAGLAARCSPDGLVFVLVDYKGGSAFDRCADLPHTVGLVTDLDGHLGERALVSLDAELTHREQLLRRAGAQDLAAYRRAGSPEGPLPRLLVVIDEFATLAAELPDFLGALVGVAQRGRSLGIHLLLATQRPSGAVDADVRANTDLRIALRVQDAADSSDIIDRPDAADLRRDRPGRAYLRGGAGGVVEVQTALSTAAPAPTAGGVELTDFVLGSDGPAPAATGDGDGPSEPTDLERLVDAVDAAWTARGGVEPRRPWLPMLPERLPLGDVLADAPDDAGLVPFALADEPARQARTVVGWRPGRGHLAIGGMVGSGATTTLRSVAHALVARRADAHVYVLDLGGDLTELDEPPQVGAVIGAGDAEGQHRLVRHLRSEVARRRELRPDQRTDLPLVTLLVDDLPALLAEHDSSEGQEFVDGLRRVLSEGPAVGIVAAWTAGRPTAVPARVTGPVAQRLLLQQADPAELTVIGVRPRDLPTFVPGRGLLEDGRVVQVGLPGPLPDTDPAGGAAPRIGALPAGLAVEGLPPPHRDGDRSCLPIGLRDHDLAPASLELHPGDHVTVAGPPRSGVSSALCLLAGQLRTADPDVVLVAIADQARSPLWGHPSLDACGALGDLDDLLEVAAEHDRRWAFLVDDAHAVVDAGGRLEALLEGSRPGLQVVAGGRADDLRAGFGHWTRLVRRSRTGVLLRPDLAVDGELLSARLPRRLPLGFPTGRGFLVQGGAAEVIQVARPHHRAPPGSLPGV